MPKLGTARELMALEAAAELLAKQGVPYARELKALHAKLTKVKPKTPGAPMAQIEEALVANSNGRVVPIHLPGHAWAALSKRYGDLQASVDDAVAVGKYIGRAPWWQQDPTTVDKLIFHWPSFLARAKAMGTAQEAHVWNRPEAEGLE